MIGLYEIGAEGSGNGCTASARDSTRAAIEEHQHMGSESGWSAAATQLAELAEKT